MKEDRQRREPDGGPFEVTGWRLVASIAIAVLWMGVLLGGPGLLGSLPLWAFIPLFALIMFTVAVVWPKIDPGVLKGSKWDKSGQYQPKQMHWYNWIAVVVIMGGCAAMAVAFVVAAVT